MPDLVPNFVEVSSAAGRGQRVPVAVLVVFALVAAMIVITSRPAHAATLDSRVTFYAESHRKPTTCIFGRLTAQGSAGRPQGVPGKTILIQKKYKLKPGWRIVTTTKTTRGGHYGTCIEVGHGKRKGRFRVAVRPYTISKGYYGSRDVSRSAYFW